MASSSRSLRRRIGRRFNSRPVLLAAFAFAVMADPVSSVAYAIEAALRALHGDLGLLLATMGLVVAIIALIITNYHQLLARFPEGGGAAAAAGRAFGEGWAFVPIGALIVDFVLTIAISVSAGASALIDYVPGLASARVGLALVLLAVVAALTWFGHIGRAVFALMTIALARIHRYGGSRAENRVKAGVAHSIAGRRPGLWVCRVVGVFCDGPEVGGWGVRGQR
jgi:amino acid transporter